jgi:hypothetical protein
VSEVGKKYDDGKTDYTLIPFDALTEVVKVLEFGAKRYGAGNWQYLEDGERRYLKALFRHLVRLLAGETHDPDSGLHHMAHVGCNALFALALSIRTREAAEKKLMLQEIHATFAQIKELQELINVR